MLLNSRKWQAVIESSPMELKVILFISSLKALLASKFQMMSPLVTGILKGESTVICLNGKTRILIKEWRKQN